MENKDECTENKKSQLCHYCNDVYLHLKVIKSIYIER